MTHKIFPVLLLSAFAFSCASANKNTYKNESRGEEFRLDVVASDGYVLPVYEHRGRSYIEGRQGLRYTLRVRNHSARRIEVVAAVDGRDVVDGKSMDSDKRGYIINPHDSAVIDGWRTSMDTVAAFRFTSPQDAYSTRMGSSTRQVGKIEVAVFYEKEPERAPLALHGTTSQRTYDDGPFLDEMSMESEMPSETAAAPRRKKSNLGTQFGETRRSGVQEVDFVRDSSNPDFWLGLRYDDAPGLCDRGIKDFCGQDRPPIQPVHNRPPARQFAQPPP